MVNLGVYAKKIFDAYHGRGIHGLLIFYQCPIRFGFPGDGVKSAG